MTLVIGCITDEYGFIAADTQLTIGNLNNGTTRRREPHIKIQRPSLDLAYGILGSWSHYIPDRDKPGRVYITDFYDLLQKGINGKEDKKTKIIEFVSGKKDIDATVLILEKLENSSFTLNEVSSQNDNELIEINIEGSIYRFNEPYKSINKTYVRNLLIQFKEEHNLGNSLTDNIFLINNVLLSIISKGESLTIQNEEKVAVIADNTVGGYITYTVLKRENNSQSNFHTIYRRDPKVFLDKTTFPYATFVDNNLCIRYINNLAMLVKNVYCPFKKHLKNDIISLIQKQIHFISTENIIDINLMNELIHFVNEKYELGLDQLEVKHEMNKIVGLEHLFFENNQCDLDINYFKRFF